MKTEIISDKTIKTLYRTVKRQVDKFVVTESYKDGVLQSQNWSVEGGFATTHPTAYEPHYMHFNYYEDISFLDSEENCYSEKFRNSIPNSSFILDWQNFDKLDHILCDYITMDGFIYKITDPKPVALWKHKDYIGGFCNDQYDLDKVVAILKKKKYIRNVEIVDIPYYNQEPGHTQAVEFDYKLVGGGKELVDKLKKHKIFQKHYIGI